MHADEDSAGELWQHLEEEDRRIRVHERSVRAVEEQHVAVGQLVEYGQVRRFERHAKRAVAELLDVRARLRVDGDDPRFEAAVAPGARRELGRGAGTDLDVERRRTTSDEGVDGRAVQGRQPVIGPRGLARVLRPQVDVEERVAVRRDRLERLAVRRSPLAMMCSSSG